MTIDGVDVARLHRTALRERAQAEVSGSDWELASHRGVIVATGPDGAPRCTARGEGVWVRRWTLDLGTTALRMLRAGSRNWWLVDKATGADAGAVHVRGVFSPRAEAQLADGTAPEVVMFVLWVADVRARRRATAAGG